MNRLILIDEWMHTHGLTWLTRAVGLCHAVSAHLDAMERAA